MGRISWSLAWLACALSLCLACGEQAPEGDTKGIVDVISETVTAPAGGCHTDADCPVNDNVCTPNRCLGDGSCVAKSALGPCDDGEPCTMSDTCVAGKCVGTDLCECRVTKDCAGLEDADACNGTLYCHTKTLPYRCRVNPTSVVSCKAAAGVCAESRCDPTTGKCADEPVVDGTPCNDGDACTVESACKGGECAGSDASWCQCQADDDCAKLGQGDLCDGDYFCDKGTFPFQCEVNPATVVNCSDAKDTTCAKNACSPKSRLRWSSARASTTPPAARTSACRRPASALPSRSKTARRATTTTPAPRATSAPSVSARAG